MLTKTITYNTYKFSELSEYAQNCVIDLNRDRYIAQAANLTREYSDHDLTYLLSQLGFPDAEIQYDLSYRQGSGLCFTSDFSPKSVETFRKVLSDNNMSELDIVELYESIYDVLTDESTEVYLSKINHFYLHEKTVEARINVIDEEECIHSNARIEHAEYILNDIREIICLHLRDRLRDYYENLYSNSYIHNDLSNSEMFHQRHMYLKDGSYEPNIEQIEERITFL